ncbi:MAG: hypothetical protein M1837_003683 [Sclerophora amabilis]|nr:MAG: hypothetical protein M1837_003683 [Sclerophora amabilis]
MDRGPKGLRQTVAVVDRSGKVISTSKTLLGVFKEAKAAYHERKAEIVADRHFDIERAHARRAVGDLAFGDARSRENGSRASSRGSRQTKSRSKSTPRDKDPDRHRSESLPRTAQTLPSLPTRSGYEFDDGAPPRSDLSRRHARRSLLSGSAFFPDTHIDMDLAYGELPPPLPVTTRAANDNELRGLMSKVTTILDEAKCVQHSVGAMISSLQRDPEALAAVALALAEISNIAAKLSPGALTALKGSFPAAVALLASPQFMIAAGVGVVVVALGGYKIIRKIKARDAAMESMDELQEIGRDVSRIESWRRGIAVVEANSIATSVEGEFITPEAIALMNIGEDAERARTSKKQDKGKGSKGSRRKEKRASSTEGGRPSRGRTSATEQKSPSHPLLSLPSVRVGTRLEP